MRRLALLIVILTVAGCAHRGSYATIARSPLRPDSIATSVARAIPIAEPAPATPPAPPDTSLSFRLARAESTIAMLSQRVENREKSEAGWQYPTWKWGLGLGLVLLIAVPAFAD